VGSTLFFSVAVFETKKAMYRYYKKSQRGFKRVGLGFEAIVVSRHTVDYRGKVGRSRPKMGEMLFVRRSLTMNIITHESGHAALVWYRRKFPQQSFMERMDREEKFCYALGDIGRQIVIRTQRYFLGD
jgi:hypothetical protein